MRMVFSLLWDMYNKHVVVVLVCVNGVYGMFACIGIGTA